MHARVQMWGNSLALRIPRPFATEAGIKVNSEVEVSLRDGDLIVRPLKRRSLVELLAGVTPDNLHGEFDTGAPVGKESW